MIDKDDEINEFSPDAENEEAAKEYNPYSEFLNDLDEEPKSDLENRTLSDPGNGVPRSNNPDMENSNVVKSDVEEHITTEEDIELPDFLRTAADVNDFQKTVEENPSIKDEPHFNNKDTNDSFSENATPLETDNGTPYSNNPEMENPNDVKPDMVERNIENQTENNSSEENKNKFTADTLDAEEDKRFVPKDFTSEADKHPGGKPRVLNKKFLLTIIIIVVGGIFLITFLMPTGGKKKGKNEKPVAETHQSKDYASIATKHPLPDEYDAEDSGHYGNVFENKKEDDEIPPVIVETEKKPYEPQYVNKNTGNGVGSSSSVEIPDTRNDSLQSKRISGIKGLSSTQQSYSTDYQQTIAKNTSSTSATSSYSLPSKDEYMNNVLSAYSQAYGNAAAGNNAYNMQNDQAGKNSFFNNGRNGNNVGQGEWLNLNTLWQGSIFEAVLTSELNTDLPGEITARISKNIYSSQDGRYLLIPQNSVLYGTYNSSISYSQSRVQVAWHTLIRPDGYQIQLGNMNGTDAKGASGLKGFVNDHPMAYLKAIGLMSVFSIVNSEFSSTMGETQNQYVQNIIANTQQVTNELADKLIDRAMNVQPTIKIKAGTKINIVVNQNLSLPPVENIEVTQPYHRTK